MSKFLEAIIGISSLIFLFVIFPFWTVVVAFVLLTVGYMVIMLLVALFVVSTESVLDKQNPMANFIREAKKANADRMASRSRIQG